MIAASCSRGYDETTKKLKNVVMKNEIPLYYVKENNEKLFHIHKLNKRYSRNQLKFVGDDIDSSIYLLENKDLITKATNDFIKSLPKMRCN